MSVYNKAEDDMSTSSCLESRNRDEHYELEDSLGAVRYEAGQ